jgi:hypothetical protein
MGFVLAALAVPALSAQDLAKYRNFSLGSSLTVVSKQAQARPDDVTVVHEKPALMQEMKLWLVDPMNGATKTEPVEHLQLFFLNKTLYEIKTVYKTAATEGMTDEDMIRALSMTYGVATRLAAPSASPDLSFDEADVPLAVWEDSQYSVTLFRAPLRRSFQLISLSKPLYVEAETAIAAAEAAERASAPERESARVEKEASDMQTTRETNVKGFRP